MSQPGYPNAQPLATLVEMLRQGTAGPAHAFWHDNASILDHRCFRHDHLHSPRQLTDLYLLALAVKNEGCLASFDRRIPLAAVHGATEAHLALL